jgi:hypothetical protein
MDMEPKELASFKAQDLRPGEAILHLIPGLFPGGRRTGVLILTDQRLAFLSEARFAKPLKHLVELADVDQALSTRPQQLLLYHQLWVVTGSQAYQFSSSKLHIGSMKPRLLAAVRATGKVCLDAYQDPPTLARHSAIAIGLLLALILGCVIKYLVSGPSGPGAYRWLSAVAVLIWAGEMACVWRDKKRKRGGGGGG